MTESMSNGEKRDYHTHFFQPGPVNAALIKQKSQMYWFFSSDQELEKGLSIVIGSIKSV